MATYASCTLSRALLYSPSLYCHNCDSATNPPPLSFISITNLKTTSVLAHTTISCRCYLTSPKFLVRVASVNSVEKKTDSELVEKSMNTIRFLAIDAVEKANSGHPGLAMGCAPLGHILFDEIMRYNLKNPYWFGRDRFLLSAGHGCMLHCALVHLASYDSIKVHTYLCFSLIISKVQFVSCCDLDDLVLVTLD